MVNQQNYDRLDARLALILTERSEVKIMPGGHPTGHNFAD
jgi:hypothetical protein